MRVGILGFDNDRGLGTLTRSLAELLPQIQGVEVSVFNAPGGSAAYQIDANLQWNPKLFNWVLRQECLITMEIFTPNLNAICARNKIKTIWIPMQEWIPKQNTDQFAEVDHIVAPTHSCADLLEKKWGLKNVTRCPWILPLSVRKSRQPAGKTHFLFNMGTGGVGDRRNFKAVAGAIELLKNREDIDFTVKSQVTPPEQPLPNTRLLIGNWSYNKAMKLYKKTDFSLAPSRWEGLGYAILESLYSGTPVLSVDAPPMNEWIEHKTTGYLCPVVFKPGINWVQAADTTSSELASGIEWLTDNKLKEFDRINKQTLDRRRHAFFETWRVLCS